MGVYVLTAQRRGGRSIRGGAPRLLEAPHVAMGNTARRGEARLEAGIHRKLSRMEPQSRFSRVRAEGRGLGVPVAWSGPGKSSERGFPARWPPRHHQAPPPATTSSIEKRHPSASRPCLPSLRWCSGPKCAKRNQSPRCSSSPVGHVASHNLLIGRPLGGCQQTLHRRPNRANSSCLPPVGPGPSPLQGRTAEARFPHSKPFFLQTMCARLDVAPVASAQPGVRLRDNTSKRCSSTLPRLRQLQPPLPFCPESRDAVLHLPPVHVTAQKPP